MKKVSVIGAGSWGTALAVLLANNGHEVMLWSVDSHEIEMLTTKREQEDKLPGVILPENITVEADLETSLKDKDIVVMAVPSPVVRTMAKQMASFIEDGQVIVNVAKGIEDVTYMTLSEIIEEEIPNAEVCVLSGPSHAEEVGKGIPTTVVVSSRKKEIAEMLQDTFMSEVFRVYTNPDIIGIELGGALKNVIALAAGTTDGLGYGDNTKAALMTRGIAELSRLGVALGGKPETFSGLTGVGDLIVTCTSVHSRNRKAGYLIGKGMTADEAMKEVKMVVEGVYSAKAALGLAKKCGVSVPIVEAVNRVLFENADPKEEVTNLLVREPKKEYNSLEWDKTE
ncbi:glycerol-3-phosphate dehydrogenase [Anaerostipes sp. 494a]|uniref:NAD(P)H-dependent glycerol-3-phosphate dehydrogenase n=1 Tax=Anaerostipes sp. 494a TaxID=1261636 RepID=UPI0009513BB2|nr:NAD(P)H-dependent glycerol-3-phosphate dehydrogenase [Anaerostipes sp. 494a]OLR58206.1 glycerol-3-phosphate dehydrogenase [Anaerostipes sp. 494a]